MAKPHLLDLMTNFIPKDARRKYVPVSCTIYFLYYWFLLIVTTTFLSILLFTTWISSIFIMLFFPTIITLWHFLIQFCNDFWKKLLGWSYRSVHIHHSFLYLIYLLIFLLSVQASWIWSKMWVWWTFNTMKCATSHLEMSV